MLSLKELRLKATALGLNIQSDAREPYLTALRNLYLQRDYPAGPPYQELSPMLCFDYHALKEKEQKSTWTDSNWICQEKLNGIRAILHFVKGIGIFAHTRKINDINFRRSEITDWLSFAACIPSFSATVDSEVTSEGGLYQTIAMLHTSPNESRRLQRDTPLLANVFDITNWEGTDLRSKRLEERLTFLPLLHSSLTAAGLFSHFFFPPVFRLFKQDVFERIISQGGEGVILKCLNSPYQDNTSRDRTSWVKCKRETELTAYVSGYERGRPGSNWENHVAALVFSINTDGSSTVIAKVTNLPYEFRKQITIRDRAGSINLDPEIYGSVAKVSGLELSAKARRLTHPRITRWCPDLNQTQCNYAWGDLEGVRLGNVATPLLRIVGT